MAENQIAQESAFTPEAADERASSFNPAPASDAAGEFAFASEAEEAAYWAGVADGIRNGGAQPPPRLSARARDAYPELCCTAEQRGERAPADLLDFDPVSTRHRIDGWTPEKQREYVEALADSGVSRYAAARVGMSEQSVARLRRRADARSFNLACEAAIRIGARRLRSIAFERAIEGTIRRHYYHGELKSEERVYDNKLLIYLLGKVGRMIEPPEEAQAVADNWQPWMEAIEEGRPAPVLSEDEGPESRETNDDDDDEEGEFDGSEVWEDDSLWWTDFPPPAGFAGEEHGRPGERDYRRTLSPAEQAVIDADEAEREAEDAAEGAARRDRYFGFEGGIISQPREAEPFEPYEPFTGLADEAGGDDGS